MKNKIQNSFEDSIEIKKKILASNSYYSISKMSEIAVKKIKKGGKIFFCGNGGSAADAQHLAAEMIVRLKPDHNRKALPGIALSLDVSTLTACSNDFGFDKIYERALESIGCHKDVLIIISTSGNSRNIINVMKKAKKMKILVFGFLGSKGGKALKYCDKFFLVPSHNTAHIQESHITAGHALIECIEDNFFKIRKRKNTKNLI